MWCVAGTCLMKQTLPAARATWSATCRVRVSLRYVSAPKGGSGAARARWRAHRCRRGVRETRLCCVADEGDGWLSDGVGW